MRIIVYMYKRDVTFALVISMAICLIYIVYIWIASLPDIESLGSQAASIELSLVHYRFLVTPARIL